MQSHCVSLSSLSSCGWQTMKCQPLCIRGSENNCFQKTQNKTQIQWEQTALCFRVSYSISRGYYWALEFANISIWKKVIVWKNILRSIHLGQLSVYWNPAHAERGLWEYQEAISICDILDVTWLAFSSIYKVCWDTVSFLSAFIMYLMHSDCVCDSSMCVLHPEAVLFILGRGHGVASHRNEGSAPSFFFSLKSDWPDWHTDTLLT